MDSNVMVSVIMGSIVIGSSFMDSVIMDSNVMGSSEPLTGSSAKFTVAFVFFAGVFLLIAKAELAGLG